MSKPRPITEEEREQLRHKVDLAWHRQAAHLSPFERETLLEALKPGAIDARLFFRLLVGRVRTDSEEFQGRMLRANAAKEDGKFFHQYARVRDLVVQGPSDFRMGPVQQFLLTHWDSPNGECPELFYFGQDALAIVCKHALKMPGFSSEAARKARDRLELPVFLRCKIRKSRVKLRNGQLCIQQAPPFVQTASVWCAVARPSLFSPRGTQNQTGRFSEH